MEAFILLPPVPSISFLPHLLLSSHVSPIPAFYPFLSTLYLQRSCQRVNPIVGDDVSFAEGMRRAEPSNEF